MPADDVHVDEQEMREGMEPNVGDGTPDTAPERVHVDDDWAEHRKNGWRPTKKWLVARVTALTGLALAVVQSGSWDKEHTVFAVTVVSAAVLSWIVRNEEN